MNYANNFRWLLITAILILVFPSKTKADLQHSSTIVKINTEFEIGVESTMLIGIIPNTGYKWNTEFPSKISFRKKPSLIKVKHAIYEKDEFYTDDADYVGAVLLPIKFMPVKKGKEFLLLLARYSVCNDETCAIESIKLEIEITVY